MEAPPIFMASLKEQSQQIMGGGDGPFNALFPQIPSSDHSTNPAAFMANYAQHIYSLNLPTIPSNEKPGQMPPPTSLAAFGHGGFGQTTVVKMEEGGQQQFGGNGGGFLLGGCQEDEDLEFHMGEEGEDEEDEDEEGEEGENISREDGGGGILNDGGGGDDIGAAAGQEGSPNGRQQQQLFVEFGGRKHGAANSALASSNGLDVPERRSIASFSDNDAVHLLAPLGHHSLSLAPQQQPQSIHQPILPIPPTSSSSGQQPISVIVHPNGAANQQQQSQKPPPPTTMEEHECGGWNDPIIVGARGAPNSSSSSSSISIAGGPNSLLPNSHHHHNHPHSMLIRDDFIFSQSAAQCASPPSAAIGGAGNDFLYDQPIGVANSLLEDSFLNSMPPNPLLDIPCSSSGISSLTGFLDLHHQQQQQQQRHRRDSSVGISPCSSSTQISASSPDDSIFAAPPNHAQHFLHNRQFSSDANCPQFPSALSLTNAGGINGQNVQQNFRIYQPKMQQSRQQQIFGAHSVEDEGEMMGEEEEGELGEEEEEANDAENEECRRGAAMLMGGEEEDFDEAERDVKPTFRIIQCQTATTTTLGQMRGQQHFGNAGQFGEEDDFALSPPPPPLTPPSKTRSKMHDLALKHRLISNQNLRSQGVIYLSPEEKKTLVQEGFPIPTKLPLMREEEEALKIVRRKIKNKLSAQESRRKRKEYMDMLEKRVHAYFADNTALRQKIRQLEATNRYLMTQMHQQKGGGGLQENDVKQK